MSTTKWGFTIVAVQTMDGVNHVSGEERKPQFFRQKISKRAKKRQARAVERRVRCLPGRKATWIEMYNVKT